MAAGQTTGVAVAFSYTGSGGFTNKVIFSGTGGVSTDITERKKNEDQMNKLGFYNLRAAGKEADESEDEEVFDDTTPV